MDDYVEDMLDSHDQQMELLAALDSNDIRSIEQYGQWLVGNDVLDGVDVDTNDA